MSQLEEEKNDFERLNDHLTNLTHLGMVCGLRQESDSWPTTMDKDQSHRALALPARVHRTPRPVPGDYAGLPPLQQRLPYYDGVRVRVDAGSGQRETVARPLRRCDRWARGGRVPSFH